MQKKLSSLVVLIHNLTKECYGIDCQSLDLHNAVSMGFKRIPAFLSATENAFVLAIALANQGHCLS